MAKQYGKEELDFAPENLMSFGKSISTMNGQPLEKSQIWYNKDDLLAFALSDSAYVGQIVTYIDTESNNIYPYQIQFDGSLKLLGSSNAWIPFTKEADN